MATRAVLFDLDDTLFDHSHSGRSGLAALQEVHEQLRQHPLDWLELEAYRLLEELHVDVLGGRLSIDKARAERMRRLLRLGGGSPTDEEAQRAADHYRAVYQSSRSPVPGAVELLEAIKRRGAQVAIVTNNLTDEQRDKLECCGLDHLTDVLVTSEEVGETKPNAAIFEVALIRTGCGADAAVMVGDSWTADVLGAHAAGIRAVWLNRRRLPCPDATVAAEIQSLQPVEQVLELLLG
jgi:HAD superfamily hydrolase (TIGR01549 family)